MLAFSIDAQSLNKWNKLIQTNKTFNMDIYKIYSKYYIGIMVRVFANDPGHLSSIPGSVIPKTQKMVLDASLLNTVL